MLEPRSFDSRARSASASPARVPRPGRRMSSSSTSRISVQAPCYVGQREVDADELEPYLNGKVGERVGQHGPQAVSADEPPGHHPWCKATRAWTAQASGGA